VLSVNLKAPFFLTQLVAQHMMERNIKGSIVNISSISANLADHDIAHYEASKAGLTMFTKSAAYALAAHSIRVNAIIAGLTATNINRAQREHQNDLWQARISRIPLGRAGKPSDYAAAVVFLATEESSWMTGASLTIDGGESIYKGMITGK